MPRDSRVYLEDILEAGVKIEGYVAGYSFEAFQADSKTFDAVVRILEINGEAIKHLPEELRAGHPEIGWKRVAGRGCKAQAAMTLKWQQRLNRCAREDHLRRRAPRRSV
jgi:uncharacterized protein with HEPN domain